jgi:NADPH-dependent 2,4-dienoyl-CoA reductase/sulfur reductase-like enzyme/nitrite reductase/ring-hydroxylating ferredoxin subunit
MVATTELSGPDLERGVSAESLPDGGTLLGHAEGEAVLLVRRGQELFALGASCTHYGGPLAEGTVVGDSIRCPWHHARFDLRTGAATAPALRGVTCWRVERRGPMIVVRGKRASVAPSALIGPDVPERLVIVGGGAAGHAAATTLRREGYPGRILMVSIDASVPYDRPNASKDYLAGTAPEEWMPLSPPESYAAEGIELRLGTAVREIHAATRRVVLDRGEFVPYDALLLATGAAPIRLTIPGAELRHVHYLRSLADSRAIIDRAKHARRAVVVGASFIGLEAAASLRARGVEVHVVAPDPPLVRPLGPRLSAFIQRLHEQHGVVFHIGPVVHAITRDYVTFSDGSEWPADMVVVGVGVRPDVALAVEAGLRVDGGVLVDEYLQSSAPGIYAAGDIARYPDARTGRSLRVEHWVVAQRQGETAARNMLGQRVRYEAVPFFWSQHYDTAIHYVGHAERWDRMEIAGNVEAGDCVVAFCDGERIAAVATIGRDEAGLRAEAALERDDQAALAALVAESAR